MPAATNLAYLFIISPSKQDKMLIYTGFITALERKLIKKKKQAQHKHVYQQYK